MQNVGFSFQHTDHYLTDSELAELSPKTRQMIDSMDELLHNQHKRPHLLACLQHQLTSEESSGIPEVHKSAYYHFCSISFSDFSNGLNNKKSEEFTKLNNIHKVVDVGTHLASLLGRSDEKIKKKKRKAAKKSECQEAWIQDANIFLRPFGQRLVWNDQKLVVENIKSKTEETSGTNYNRDQSRFDALFVCELVLEGASDSINFVTSLVPNFTPLNADIVEENLLDNSLNERAPFKGEQSDNPIINKERLGTYKLALISGATVAGVFIAYKFLLPAKKAKKEENGSR